MHSCIIDMYVTKDLSTLFDTEFVLFRIIPKELSGKHTDLFTKITTAKLLT